MTLLIPLAALANLATAALISTALIHLILRRKFG